jgi:4-amino-4-deoxy-L-arabinose transferase-like glycosyltransferase
VKVFNFLKVHFEFFALSFLCLIGFSLRLRGLSANFSYWTDEDHVAIFARAILERGRPVLSTGYTTGSFQSLWYWITAIFMGLTKTSEFGSRLPSVFFGVLTIYLVFLTGKKLLSRKVGLVASLFTTFLTIEILWSRQARPYQALQFFYLLETIFFLTILERIEKKRNCVWALGGLIASIGFSSLIHWFGLLPLVVFVFYLVLIRGDITNRMVVFVTKGFRKVPVLSSVVLFVGLSSTFFVLWKLGFFVALKLFIFPAFGKIGFYNHFSYYHSFLWRQYGLLTFLALLGIISLIFRHYQKGWLPVVFISLCLGYITFRLRVPFSRYLYPVFPFYIILSAEGLIIIAEAVGQSLPHPTIFVKKWLYLFLAIFIVANGYKFTLKPKAFYSLNTDMQEIPEVDFKGMYSRILEMTKNRGEWVLVNTWADHATWYLGENRPDYWLRDPRVMYGEDSDLLSGAKLIGSFQELEEIIKTKKKGLIILESWEPFVPEGVREYIKQNLKKEFEVDRIYPLQPRYWPVEVYSWGI